MRFTIRNDAKDLGALAARIAGPNADLARREAVAKRIRELHPHLDDLEKLPRGAPILLPDDVEGSAEHTDTDPRIAHALGVAEEATKAAQETIRGSFEREEEKAEQQETELRRRRETANDPQVAEQIGEEIKQLREERAGRKADLERISTALEKTAGTVAKLWERKRV